MTYLGDKVKLIILQQLDKLMGVQGGNIISRSVISLGQVEHMYTSSHFIKKRKIA